MAVSSLRRFSSPVIHAHLGKGFLGNFGRLKTSARKAADSLKKCSLRLSAGDDADCAGFSSKTVRLLNLLKRGSDNNSEERQST
jgi:hypothetical protein